MNIEQANTIPVARLLEKLGHMPVKENDNEAWYNSPLRKEHTASFKINKKSNVWYDFGIPYGGDVVEFASLYLKSQGEDCTISDGLRFITNLADEYRHFIDLTDRPIAYPEQKLLIKSVEPIKHISLIRYVERRGIAIDVAREYLKEIRLYNKNTNSHLFTLGIKNEENGYDLRNPMFKGTVGKKNISFIRGSRPETKGIHVFEGSFDFLSALSQLGKHQFNEDAIILNSLSCMRYLAPYVKFHGYRKAYSWFDNDDAGNIASGKLHEFCKEVEGLSLVKMNNVYSNFKDVNSWHLAISKRIEGHKP